MHALQFIDDPKLRGIAQAVCTKARWGRSTWRQLLRNRSGWIGLGCVCVCVVVGRGNLVMPQGHELKAELRCVEWIPQQNGAGEKDPQAEGAVHAGAGALWPSGAESTECREGGRGQWGQIRQELMERLLHARHRAGPSGHVATTGLDPGGSGEA